MNLAAMFGYRAVIFLCLFLADHGGTISLIRAAIEERHSIEGYVSDAAHESQISHSPLVTFVNVYGRHVCEGTLVTPFNVLTAASCVDASVTGFDPSHLSVIIATGEGSALTAVGEGILCTEYD